MANMTMNKTEVKRAKISMVIIRSNYKKMQVLDMSNFWTDFSLQPKTIGTKYP